MPRCAAAGARCGRLLVERLDQAVARAIQSTPAGGVLLLSPGAPSFDQFHDYAARGARFAQLGGFDARLVGIDGMGIA